MFSTSQAFGTQAPMGAQEVTPKKARSEDKQTCLPTTIRAIETAISESTDGGSIRFYGTEQSMLIVVGVVESLVKQAASMEFSLNDATGRIKARFYLSDRQSAALERLAVGSHVCAFGNVRTAPVQHLAVTGMRLVESADEISFHMIEAALAAVKLQKAQGGEPMALKRPALAVEAIAAQPMRPAAAEFSPPKQAPAERLPQLEPAAQAKPAQAKLDGQALRRAVMAFLQKEGESRPEGVSLSDLCEEFRPATADDVSKTLDQLVGDGDVFTTIDDDHFSCV